MYKNALGLRTFLNKRVYFISLQIVPTKRVSTREIDVILLLGGLEIKYLAFIVIPLESLSFPLLFVWKLWSHGVLELEWHIKMYAITIEMYVSGDRFQKPKQVSINGKNTEQSKIAK